MAALNYNSFAGISNPWGDLELGGRFRRVLTIPPPITID